MAPLTNPRDSRVAFQLYPLMLEYFLRRSRDRRLGDRGETGSELLSGSQTMLHIRLKVFEEPLGRLLLPLGLVSRRRAAFLLVLFPFVTLFRVSASKIVPASIAEGEFGGVVFGRFTVAPKALPGAQIHSGA